MLHLVRFAFLALLVAPSAGLQTLDAEPIPLAIEAFNGPTPKFTQQAGGVWQVEGPMSLRATPSRPASGQNWVLSFDYFCVGGMKTYAVLPGPPFQAATARYLPDLAHSEAWVPYVARLVPAGKPLPENWKQLRFDLPLPQGRILQLRNLQIRPEQAGDFARLSSRRAHSSHDVLQDYLNLDFPARIDKVEITTDSIVIEGTAPEASGPLHLADIPMDLLIEDPACYQDLHPVPALQDGKFTMELPRMRKRSGRDYDRLTSRWQLVRKEADRVVPLSHCRYAETIACRNPALPEVTARTKKGLGGWNAGRHPGELDDLGISAVTVNVMIHALVSPKPVPGTTPFTWQGRTYHANQQALERLDRTFLKAAEKDVLVSAILLVANPARGGNEIVRKLGHPDAVKEGTFAHPDVVSEEGIALYGAILNLMAERWSRPDGRFGRVHHWIVHNEVDAAWTWTNVGPNKTGLEFMDLYQRSMRLVDLITRQHDPHARAFITLTHHWAKAGNARFYGSKQMVDRLVSFCQVEGDFPWAMAHHPYPQSLRVPTTWNDQQATFSFESNKITPRNLEVLDAYMKLPRLRYRGEVRPVHLSENGFNSPTYSEKDLTEQAAGMAYAWKKISSLDSIKVWHYHNWVDNRHEGGLRIGLRKFPDEPGDPAGKKPIWHFYQALATPREDEVASPYLKVIGIPSWDAVHHREAIR